VKSQNLKAGDKFVVSADCDTVSANKKRDISKIDGGDIISQLTGFPTADNIFPPSLSDNGGLSYIIAGFGDLGPGIYNATMNVVSGAVSGSFMSDNLGNNLTANDDKLQAGESKQYSFSVGRDGSVMGVGLLVATNDNKTNVTWSFVARELPASQQPSTPFQPSNTDIGADIGSARSKFDFGPLTMIGISSLLFGNFI